MYKGNTCDLAPDHMDFLDADTFSQFVITESAASCWAKMLAASNIGKIHMDTKRAQLLWNDTSATFNTTQIASHMPIFREKLGENKTLKAGIYFLEPKVSFQSHDADVVFEYTLAFDIR